jgi:type I restriction enzyme S subunit
MGDLLMDIEAGRSFKCSERPAGPDEWGVIKVSAMTWREFGEGENKAVLRDHKIDPRFEIQSGDLLFSRANTVTYVGAVVQVGETRPRLLLSDKSLRLVPHHSVSPRWLLYYLRSRQARQYLESLATGTSDSMRNISQVSLRGLPVPLAPCREQEQVVAAIEEQFSRLDAGVAALERVRRNLKRVRDLLPLLLLADIGSAADHVRIGVSPSYEGPYPWMPLAELSQQVVDCEHWTPTYLPEGMPCIDTTCISAGVIHRDRIRYVDPATHRSRVRRLAPQHGDLIFAREGTVGTAVVVPKDLNPCLGQRVMLFRPNPEEVDSDYLCLVVNSQIVKRQYRPMILGTTVPHLNVRDARVLRIPLPALTVQRAIAAEAERIGSVLTAIEAAVELNETRSSSVRSSIFDAAFAGRLVTQDPTDEPASAVLDRMAAKRTSFNGRRRPIQARTPRAPREDVTA